MAKIQFGTVITDMRGKQGGVVYARNRYTNYSRNKTSPVNPGSAKQSQIRVAFASLSSGWRALTLAQRNAWAALAATSAKTNVFGQSFFYTAQNMYMSLNGVLLSLGLPINNLAAASLPSIPDYESPVDDAVQVSIANGFANNLSYPTNTPPTEVPTEFTLQIQATPILSPALNEGSVKKYFRNVSQVAGGQTVEDLNLAADYIVNFSNPSTPDIGAAIWFRQRTVDTATGAAGSWLISRSIVTA